MPKHAARGRPPKGAGKMMEPITIRFPPLMMQEIKAMAEGRMDAPEKSDVIRQLVAEALTARAKRRG